MFQRKLLHVTKIFILQKSNFVKFTNNYTIKFDFLIGKNVDF